MTELDESLLPHFVNPLLPSHDLSKEFFIARAAAIRTYASYEISLVTLFGYLMGIQPDYAGIPFFKINNARARNSIIEKLLKKRHGNTYNIFWNSLAKLLNAIDTTRNQIVHWPINVTIDASQSSKPKKLALVPPNFWDSSENTPEMTVNDLYDFIVKCDFVSRSINTFYMTISGRFDTWRDIYLQPITYPPLDNHPLFQMPQTQ